MSKEEQSNSFMNHTENALAARPIMKTLTNLMSPKNSSIEAKIITKPTKKDLNDSENYDPVEYRQKIEKN
jgi:hypothetical protein